MLTKTAKLYAKFFLDADGAPEYVEDKNLKKHYRIAIFLGDAPKDSAQCTYFLDDSYYNPIREKRNRDDNFTETTTSYGDFEVGAEILYRNPARRDQGDIERTREKLSDMIESYYRRLDPEHWTPGVQTAIAEIRAH